MLYAVKFEFDTETSMRAATEVLLYPTMEKAIAMRHTLNLKHAFGEPMAVSGGKKVDVLSYSVWEVDESDPDKAIAKVKAGDAILIEESTEP
jgi:hypothetical protein